MAFAGFDYVALGHLHRPQPCGDGRIQYSGSLLPYSFGEAGQAKAVLQVEMDAAGHCHVERVALLPRRQVRCLSGTLAELLASAPPPAAAADYLMVTLQDHGPVFDAMGRLREVYPNVLHLERAALAVAAGGNLVSPDHRQTGDAQLFAAFYTHVTGQDLDAARQNVFAQVADEARRQEGVDAR
jgi:exonuclease SbcD